MVPWTLTASYHFFGVCDGRPILSSLLQLLFHRISYHLYLSHDLSIDTDGRWKVVGDLQAQVRTSAVAEARNMVDQWYHGPYLFMKNLIKNTPKILLTINQTVVPRVKRKVDSCPRAPSPSLPLGWICCLCLCLCCARLFSVHHKIIKSPSRSIPNLSGQHKQERQRIYLEIGDSRVYFLIFLFIYLFILP